MSVLCACVCVLFFHSVCIRKCPPVPSDRMTGARAVQVSPENLSAVLRQHDKVVLLRPAIAVPVSRATSGGSTALD